MIENLYKIKLIADVNPAWFGVIVQKSLEDCRHSNDGLSVILKIPDGVKTVDDVPDEWKADFTANEPYMNHTEALDIMTTDANWIAPDPT